jgi:high-affinity iron transporter
MPLGVNAASNPGPFQASWSVRGGITVWLSHGRILDAVDTSASTLTITGGGLETSRTIVVGDDGWRVPDDGVSSAARAMAAQDSARNEAVLWGAWLPAVLALIAAALAMSGYRGRGAVGASYARTPETVPA